MEKEKWLEMWSSVKVIELEVKELKNKTIGESPHVTAYKRARCLMMEREVVKMKRLIEGQIGRME